MIRAFVAAAAAVLLSGGAGAQGAGGLPPACRGPQLQGSFAEIAGSAGAGNVVYLLSLRNRSSATCFVSGLPVVTLLARSGRALPTHGTSAHPGAGTAVLVTLRQGGRAKATARFSPDVPGPGEPTAARCEPLAYRLRVQPNGGGTLAVQIAPPTPVCEHGAMQLSLLQHA